MWWPEQRPPGFAPPNVRFARLSERRLPQTSNKLMLVYFAAVTLRQQLATRRHKRAAPLWKPRRRHAGLWSLTNARDKRGPPRRSVGNAGRAERNFARVRWRCAARRVGA